jgi:CheY-like chemotaxis protein
MDFIGEEQEVLAPVDVSQLVREMILLLEVSIPKQIRLDFEMLPSLVIPRANAAQLRQMVMNLILNAGEAIGKHHGVIKVTGRRVCWYGGNGSPSESYSDGDCIRLEISDTGVGMAQEVRQRIFDPFFSTKLAGRGLGLAAVQGIVRNHGGAIEVMSTPGEGTTFRILLPTAIDPLAGAFAEAPVREIVPRKGSILIVEDEAPLRFSVARMLAKKGFSVIEAADGDLAVDLIHDWKQDIAVVLLDLTLPGKSSQEVFAELQRVRPEVKVILTSAYSWASVSGPLKFVEHQMFIRKPYQLSQLVTVVRQALPTEEDGTAVATPVLGNNGGSGRH